MVTKDELNKKMMQLGMNIGEDELEEQLREAGGLQVRGVAPHHGTSLEDWSPYLYYP
jgi:hypothetical protein